MLSYPAIRTPWFNADGDDSYSSKMMFCIFIPSLLAALIILVMFVYPMLKDSIMDTTIDIKMLNSFAQYGYRSFDNGTNTENKPISPAFSKIYKKFIPDVGIPAMKFRPDLFA